MHDSDMADLWGILIKSETLKVYVGTPELREQRGQARHTAEHRVLRNPDAQPLKALLRTGGPQTSSISNAQELAGKQYCGLGPAQTS